VSLDDQTDFLPRNGTATTSPARGHGSRNIRRILRLTLAALVVVPTLLIGGSASATPTKAELQAKLAETQKVAEQATERYLAAKGQLDSINVRVEAATARQKVQQEAVARAKHTLGLVAAETYRSGDLASLGLFLGDDPDGLLAQSGMMLTLGERQAAAIDDLKMAEEQLAADNADLLEQQKRLAQTTKDAEDAKKSADKENASVEAQLARFTQAEIAAMNASRSGYRVDLQCNEVSVSAPNSKAQQAINYACSKIGSPYVYGAEGPNSFDCSGLTQASWKSAGVSIPRTAAQQSRVGTRISVSNRQPGDLIFFYGTSNPSHVGIYIGNGLMVHAPHSGDYVRIASDRSSSITGVVRLA
jgi:cell wall-associated NlpC family hydrolase